MTVSNPKPAIIHPAPESQPPSGMDRVIKKSRWKNPKLWWSLVIAAVVVGLSVSALQVTSKRTLRVDVEQIQLSRVAPGEFRDVIPLRATIMPLKTVYIDAVQGGTVEEIYVEEGSPVKAGDPLLKFSNISFQLQVFSQEAQISEQLDTNSTTRLQLDQNRLDLQRRLNDIEYAITRLQRQLDRSKQLLDRNLVSQNEIDRLQDELDYQLKQRELTQTNIHQEEDIRKTKILQLEESAERLNQHLQAVRKSLDSLEVRAPISGQLSALDAEIGEIKPGGARLGQVDNVEQFKLEAEVDEFYIGRTRTGQTTEFTLEGKTYKARISKVYPQVNDGMFTVDLLFTGNVPPQARPGLTVSTQLQLGANTQGLLVENGAFYQDTGGRWAFVVDAAGKQATRRPVELGRRNSDYIEVIKGLDEGDTIITSGYANWMETDEIILE